MIDVYTMILWAKANEQSLDAQAQQVFDVLTCLSKVDHLKPRYLTAKKKNDAKEFELSIENLKGSIIKKRDKRFEQLGSRISFFTSLDANSSAGISICIGVSEKRFQNTIVVDMDLDHKKESIDKFDGSSEVFKEMIDIFDPFYGCITSKSVSNMFDTYYDKISDLPTSIFDINYFGEDICDKLEIDKIKKEVFECTKLNHGYYIRLQKEPIDVLNAEHIKLQKKINSICFLSR